MNPTASLGYVQLPRNFQFIHRLPARFQMLVLSEGNKTKSAQWFKVKIGEHILNILSKAPLKNKTSYFVEKFSPYNLKIISQDKSIEKLTTETIEELATTEIKINDKVPNQSVLNQNLWGSSLADFLTSMVVYDQKEDPQINYKLDSSNRVSFEFSLPSSSYTVRGLVHKRKEGGNLVYLNFDEALDEDFIDDLKLFLLGLNVSNISLIDDSMYNKLSLGVNTIS